MTLSYSSRARANRPSSRYWSASSSRFDGRIVEHGGFQIANAATAPHPVVRASQQARVRHDFGNDVDERAEGSTYQNDPEPVGLRPAADEVQDRDGLQDEAPRIEQATQAHAFSAAL
jgi:hypothetical protein